MYLSRPFLGSLGRNALFFCSKKQVAGLITRYSGVMQEPTAESTQSQSPREILNSLRSGVGFYKESTARLFSRLAGLIVSFALLVYWLYSFHLSWPLSKMDGPLPVFVMSICMALSVCFWCSINGGSLLYLHCYGLQPKKYLFPTVAAHVLFLSLIAGATAILCAERFVSGAVFAEIGMAPAEIGTLIDTVFTVSIACLIGILVLSLWASIYCSIFYFTVGVHSLLFLSMIFLTKTLISDLTLSAEAVSYFAIRNFIVYVGVLCVLTGGFLLRFLYEKKRVQGHS